MSSFKDLWKTFLTTSFSSKIPDDIIQNISKSETDAQESEES